MSGNVERIWVWQNSRPNQPWQADEWEEDWPTETFTQGEGLPPGPLSTIGTFHNEHPDRPGMIQMLSLRLQDEVYGKRIVPIRLDKIVVPGRGVGIKARGEVGVFYHRWRKTDPIMAKLELPDGDGNGLFRVYTWWEAVERPFRRNEHGVWVPA